MNSLVIKKSSEKNAITLLPGGGMPGLSCGGPAPGGRTIKPPGAATCTKAGGISPGGPG